MFPTDTDSADIESITISIIKKSKNKLLILSPPERI